VRPRSRSFLAALAGLCLAQQLPAQAPPPLGVDPGRSLAAPAQPFANQQVANAIGDALRQSGQLTHFDVGVTFRDGTVELSGTVADQPQREEVRRIVQGVPGVERVIDRLALATPITRVQAEGAPPVISTTPAPPSDPGPAAGPPGPAIGPAVPDTVRSTEQPGTGGVPPALGGQPMIGGPGLGAPPGAPGGNQVAEPMPIWQGPNPSPYDVNQPKMPPYAWPSYAPYNNFSRVAYPTAYPYQAWPYIGPCYPFPKVPPGWRSVKLEWDDGYWWFSKVATKHDWWRLRYW
jgi:hypothetical protein